MIESRLVGKKWHHYVAAETITVVFDLPDGTKGKRDDFHLYAEPGTVNESGEVA